MKLHYFRTTGNVDIQKLHLCELMSRAENLSSYKTGSIRLDHLSLSPNDRYFLFKMNDQRSFVTHLAYLDNFQS